MSDTNEPVVDIPAEAPVEEAPQDAPQQEAVEAPAEEVPAATDPQTHDIAAAAARAAAIAASFTQPADYPVSSGVDHGDDNGNKRKYDGDGEEDGPAQKRTNGDGVRYIRCYLNIIPIAVYINNNKMSFQTQQEDPLGSVLGETSITIQCPKEKVGKVIGKQGATIKDLQLRTSTRIQVDHNFPGDSKPITVFGTPENVEKAKELVHEVMESENPSLPGDVTKTVECPAGIVGRIIGRAGETIRSLQSASSARILVNQNFPEGHPREITISGRADAVERASKMVTELISGEPGSAQAVIQKVNMQYHPYIFQA